MPWLLYPQEKAPVSIVLESGRTLWLVWTGVKKEKSLVPTGNCTPNCPDHSESLYQYAIPIHHIDPHKISQFINCDNETKKNKFKKKSLTDNHILILQPSKLHLQAIYCHIKCHCMPHINPLNPKLNPICYLLALLGAHHFLHVSRIRVKLLIFTLLMSYIYGAPILDVSRSHTTTQHSR